MTESKDSRSMLKQGGPLSIYDDDWHSGNVPAASAIAQFHVAPRAGPIMRDGKMVGWGYPMNPSDDVKIGQMAPPQGSLESKCRVQRLAQPGQIAGQLAAYELSAYYGGETHTCDTTARTIGQCDSVRGLRQVADCCVCFVLPLFQLFLRAHRVLLRRSVVPSELVLPCPHC
jgi:hypothetical protein